MHSEEPFSWDRLLRSIRDVLGNVEGWRAVTLRALVALGLMGYTTAAAVRPGDVLPVTSAGRWAALAVLVGTLALGVQAVYSKRKEIEVLKNQDRKRKDEVRREVRQALYAAERSILLAAQCPDEPSTDLLDSLNQYSERIARLPLADADVLSEQCNRVIAAVKRGDLREATEMLARMKIHQAWWPLGPSDSYDAEELDALFRSLRASSPEIVERFRHVLRAVWPEERITRLLGPASITSPTPRPPSAPESS